MVRIINSSEKEEILKLKERNYQSFDVAIDRVMPIIRDVRIKGDKALFEYSERFDNYKLNKHIIKVSEREIKDSVKRLDKKVLDAMKKAADNIRRYALLQKPKEWKKTVEKGITLGQLVRPLESVGCYVPCGSYPLPSTLLMTVVTAKAAGVKNVIVCSPPREKSYSIWAASLIAGADAVYKVGGAQSIAAMAYGTESIPKVRKIVGPGNIFVTAAKKIVYGDVDIDFIAGPTEIIIYSEKGNPEFIAADMLAQAEHDVLAMAMLVTPNKELAERVSEEVDRQASKLSTRITALESIRNFGAIIISESIKDAANIIDGFSPEHLEIMDNVEKLLPLVNNFGAVFLGEYSPEPAGDYASGPNHVLPTRGFAGSRAGLSIYDFVKMPSMQMLSKDGLRKLKGIITLLAETEGLEAHKRSAEIRFI